VVNIILCGGSGTRLWPLSRTLMPKQFVPMFNNRSLFQLTVARNKPLFPKQMIVSNAEQYFLALDQLETDEAKQHSASFLLEPVGRNTAPAIALACLGCDEEDIVLVTPSDHLIKNQEAYEAVLQQAVQLAQENNLVTFGIKPHYAETGFGYIEAQGNDVSAFHEKPDEKRAQAYLEAGNYYWNSGMFCFKAGTFLQELRRYAPEIYEASVKAMQNSAPLVSETDGSSQVRIHHDDMLNIPEESIDFAVMEHSSIVKVVPADIDWSDLGSFDALKDEIRSAADGNRFVSLLPEKQPSEIAITSHNNLIVSDKQVALIDIDDLIIVDTDDALLISKQGSSQKVKQVVTKLKEQNSPLCYEHKSVHRPWGYYSVLDSAQGFKVKRLVMHPHKRMSLQTHRHRSEHWVVIQGEALVQRGDETFVLHVNESTYIGVEQPHRIENCSEHDLVMVEVQVGSYISEDDIQRIDDDFKR